VSGGACVCLTGYILKDKLCCHQNCLTCESPDKCTSCDSNN
jgi:hypothetical protein